MKKLHLVMIAFCMLAACGNPAPTEEATASKDTSASSAPPLSYAYTATYSSDFEFGDPKLAQTVLDRWKDYDNNSFEGGKSSFADSVSMDFADGSSFKGTRDSITAMVSAYRSGFSSAVSTVNAWVTLKPKGKDETWVCIWGKEVHTDKKGKKDSLNLNENWMFDKNGKVAYIEQLSAKIHK